jgi:hypothetical protein
MYKAAKGVTIMGVRQSEGVPLGLFPQAFPCKAPTPTTYREKRRTVEAGVCQLFSYIRDILSTWRSKHMVEGLFELVEILAYCFVMIAPHVPAPANPKDSGAPFWRVSAVKHDITLQG